MILAFDTYYSNGKAKTICLAFDSWTSEGDLKIFTETLEDVEDYTSGEFYKRELPCILSLLKKVEVSNLEAIIIDGFVFLDDNNKLGLGGYLDKYLSGKVPIIGVAKNNFATIEKNKRTLLRGGSKKPLYITSIGIDVDKATEYIKSMAGNYRIPTLLKRLDSISKEKTSGNNTSS